MKELLENKSFKVFIGVILLVILIIIIAVVLVSSKNKSLTEQDLINGANAYYTKNPALLPKENYDSVSVQLSTLISNGIISNDKNISTCPIYVIVTNMNGTYSYTPVMNCADNNTANASLVSKITSNITTNGSGLYNSNGKFIFRGENPNNYVKFGESLWRIIGLDENNNIKMIYSDIYIDYYEWDNRYNKDVNQSGILDKGINNFVGNEKSRLKEYLDSFFANENNIEKFTAARIARTVKFNTCIGKANIESGNINICSDTYNSRISTITIDDYVNASLDSSCNFNDTMSCRNYNFLNLDGWTITANSSNTYQAYFIDKDEGIYTKDTYIRSAVRPVIALKNDVLYISGSGTMLDPYMIG